MNRREKAYLTVYLTLVMSILLSMCLTLIEGTRRSAIRLEAEIATETAMDSIMAEYHRELMRQYNLFAVDSSYGGLQTGSAQTCLHLKNYLDRNLETNDTFLYGLFYRDFLCMSAKDAELTKVRYLTDEEGAVFRRRAAEAMRDDLGVDLIFRVAEWARVVEENALESMDVPGELREAEHSVETNRRRVLETVRKKKEGQETASLPGEGDSLPGEKEDDTPEEEEDYEEEVVDLTPEYHSPVSAVSDLTRKGILTVVLDDTENLSARRMNTEVLIGSRMAAGLVNRGNLPLEDSTFPERTAEKLLFREYLMRYLGDYTESSENDVLLYQVEYLIAGRDSDIENLRKVADRLLMLRSAADYCSIRQDQAKVSEAAAIGALLAAAILSPELAETFREMILLAWSYMEAVYDLRTLLAGGKIPLMKNAENWHYSMTGALSALTDSAKGASSEKEGLSYRDYLRIFLYLTGDRKLTMRAMDLVEADIRMTPGNREFRLDACIDAVEANVSIISAYGYSFQLRRERGYE